MRRIPIHELKRRLSAVVEEAEGGATLLVTRHGRPVAQLGPVAAHVHVGSRVGEGRLQPLLAGPTRGRYLEVVAEDRRGSRSDV